MKNILLLIHNDNGQEARLQAALDLTRALNGHLICLDVTPSPIVVGDLYVGFGEGAVILDKRVSETIKKETLTTRLSHEDISWSWRDASGDIAGCVLDAAMLADMIVLNRAFDTDLVPDMRSITSRVLMHARTLVVAVPEALPRLNAIGRALVAWDGQASSAAALMASVPLLRLASAVEIFMARERFETTEPSVAAEYLSRHGIRATIKINDDTFSLPDHLIAAECEVFEPDYIVMGAYGRGRFVEMFGGVTKRMLTRSAVPLILGH